MPGPLPAGKPPRAVALPGGRVTSASGHPTFPQPVSKQDCPTGCVCFPLGMTPPGEKSQFSDDMRGCHEFSLEAGQNESSKGQAGEMLLAFPGREMPLHQPSCLSRSKLQHIHGRERKQVVPSTASCLRICPLSLPFPALLLSFPTWPAPQTS